MREYEQVVKFMKRKNNLDKWFYTSDIANATGLSWERVNKIMNSMAKRDNSLIKSRTKLKDWNRKATIWKMRSN